MWTFKKREPKITIIDRLEDRIARLELEVLDLRGYELAVETDAHGGMVMVHRPKEKKAC